MGVECVFEASPFVTQDDNTGGGFDCSKLAFGPTHRLQFHPSRTATGCIDRVEFEKSVRCSLLKISYGIERKVQ